MHSPSTAATPEQNSVCPYTLFCLPGRYHGVIWPVMYSGIQLSNPSIISPKERLRSCTMSKRSPFLRIAARPSIHFLENSRSCASSSIGISLQINTGSRDRENAVALRKSSVTWRKFSSP